MSDKMSEKEYFHMIPEDTGVWWRVIGVDGTDYGDLTTDSPLCGCGARTVIRTVLEHKPELRGKGFVVCDDDQERAYIIWDTESTVYDEYIHSTYVDLSDDE